MASNYDPCADASAVVVTIDLAKPNSPRQVLLFHRGTYVGNAMTRSRPYTTLNPTASTKDTVVVMFTSGKTCATCDDGTTTPVRYRWNGITVAMVDASPPPQAWP